ncbi:MAG: glycosyltransferase family 4 protein [Candidatus Omnitrophota bacterium]|jgi:glycosyltransferase involved in cell wall biosynthesis
MKIVVLGTRGFPQIQGGVEAHCENLYPRLVKIGCEVTVFGRAPYLEQCKKGDSPQSAGTVPFFYQGVKISPLSCPKNKFLEAFVHTFKGIFAAKKLKPDILHIHAIGPSLCVPFARMLGLKVVMTHHGPDYERKKWNAFAKGILKLGEKWGVRYANQVITISNTIAGQITAKYGRKAVIIPNGVAIPQILESEESLKKFGLEKGKYVLAVGRFVPEKGFEDLMEAWKIASAPTAPRNDTRGRAPGNDTGAVGHGNDKGVEWKLVIVGDADHEDEYSRKLKEKAKGVRNVVLTGFLSGQPLAELYSHAGLFVLPSYYEGLPIVLLEAMSYGLSCVVSDIHANREVALTNERYFKPGNIEELAKKINEFVNKPLTKEENDVQRELIANNYNWDKIAEQTLAVYKSVVNK